jgi:hypothetical protein
MSTERTEARIRELTEELNASRKGEEVLAEALGGARHEIIRLRDLLADVAALKITPSAALVLVNRRRNDGPAPEAERCSDVGCEDTSRALIYWPGSQPRSVCIRHAARAKSVSDTMGFYLHIRPSDPDAALELVAELTTARRARLYRHDTQPPDPAA